MTEIRRLTKEQMASFGYSMAELRQLAREHGVFIPRDSLHHELVHALTAAGIKLPPKQACLTTAGPDEAPGPARLARAAASSGHRVRAR